MDRHKQSLTRALLMCGAVAGPLFLTVVLVQDYTRAGFDPRVDALSLLSLGDLGFIQIANFILAGILNLCYAAGLWRTFHTRHAGAWASLLIGAYGLGLITVGIFTTDPRNGFPPGVAIPPRQTWHSFAHALGGLFVFLTLASALLVFARWFWKRRARWWAAYCSLTSVLLLVLFFSCMSSTDMTARFLRLATLLGWGAASLTAVQVMSASRSAAATEHASPVPLPH